MSIIQLITSLNTLLYFEIILESEKNRLILNGRYLL